LISKTKKELEIQERIYPLKNPRQKELAVPANSGIKE
jgi:hypothetical protein